VSLESGKTIVEAQAYIALQTSDDLKPSRDYLQTVIDGAREHQLSSEYITRIEQTPIEAAADAVKADRAAVARIHPRLTDGTVARTDRQELTDGVLLANVLII
jgi:hypothetical protein